MLSTMRSRLVHSRPADLTNLSPMSTFHDFEMTSITGDQVSFDEFQGQVCLVVNVATN